jgi:hypothetical protein
VASNDDRFKHGLTIVTVGSMFLKYPAVLLPIV